MSISPTMYLFSYGTLRQPEVQQELFGRLLPATPDAIAGYRLDNVVITDPAVIATSGSDRHPVLRPTDDPFAAVEGTAFELTPDELAAADRYEVADYVRVLVPLVSGVQAWAYVLAG